MDEEKEIDLVQLIKILWKNKTKLIKYGAIGFGIGVVIAFSIPKEYKTTVKIAPEGSGESSNFGGMGALAGMAGIDLGQDVDGITAAIYPDIVKSTPFLLEFAAVEVDYNDEKISFYNYVTKEQRKAWWGHIFSAPFKMIGFIAKQFSDKVENEDEINIFKPTDRQQGYIAFLHKNITLTTDKKTKILAIDVTMQDALISAIIADSLLSKLQVYMTEYKTNKIRTDLIAKKKMLIESKQSFYLAEETLARALDYNRNIKSKKANIKIDRLSNEMDLAYNMYKQLATQVEASKVQLLNHTPIATIIEPSSVAIKASSPNKPLIAILFAFLGGAIMAVIILYKNQLLFLHKQD